MREYGTKTTLVFFPADGESSWLLLPNLVSLLSGGTVQRENTSMREYDTKITLVFLPADEEASWLLLPSLVSLLSGGTVQRENTYSHFLKVTGQVWESQKKVEHQH